MELDCIRQSSAQRITFFPPPLFFLQATLTILDKLDIENEHTTEEEVARKFGWEEDYLANDLSLWQRVKPKIWSLFDEPHSSTFARVSSLRTCRRGTHLSSFLRSLCLHAP